MSHITWSKDKAPVELEADYVVVGTGAGGARYISLRAGL